MHPRCRVCVDNGTKAELWSGLCRPSRAIWCHCEASVINEQAVFAAFRLLPPSIIRRARFVRPVEVQQQSRLCYRASEFRRTISLHARFAHSSSSIVCLLPRE